MSALDGSEYCWIRIRIFKGEDVERADSAPRGGMRYPVEADLDDGRLYVGSFHFGPPERADLLELEAGGNLREYGLRLGRWLFSGQVRSAYEIAFGRAQSRTGGRLRVQLWISPECSELQALKWELIYVEMSGRAESLSSAGLTPFSRYWRLPRPDPEPLGDRPLKLLVALANPEDLPEQFKSLDVEAEIKNIFDAVKDIKDLQVTFLPGRSGVSNSLQQLIESQPDFKIEGGSTTLDRLQQELAGLRHHILHYVGHGHFHENRSILLLENEEGKTEPVDDGKIKERFSGREVDQRLIFLAACETARRNPEDGHPFVGLGPKLIEAGFPAIVAMQENVEMRLASRLTHFFYRRLLDHGLVDLALNEARGALLNEKLGNWAVPVLFIRTSSWRLFTDDPARAALVRMKEEHEFQPRLRHFPLEAIMLSQQQITPNWERKFVPSLAQAETRVDLWSQVNCLLDGDDGRQRLLIAITGERGSARSSVLQRLVRETAIASLRHAGKELILPIYIDLEKYCSEIELKWTQRGIITFLRLGLNKYWPSPLSDEDVETMLQKEKMRFRIVFDNGDDLPEWQRYELELELDGFIQRHSRHQFLFGMGRGCWKWGEEWLTVTHLLDVQLMSRAKVEQYLDGGVTPEPDQSLVNNTLTRPLTSHKVSKVGGLKAELERKQLFDLASQPWLLARIIEEAQYGKLPRSRVSVLQDLIEELVLRIPPKNGLQACALDTLYEMAREMQLNRRGSLPIKEAIPIMAGVRGSREYALEDMFEELIDKGLLARSGKDALRFLYSPLQAYCCARSLAGARDFQRWEEVTAGLGRLTHLRRWSDTLTLLCGMLDDPLPLLRLITYGTSLKDGEQIYLAARCLQEVDSQREAESAVKYKSGQFKSSGWITGSERLTPSGGLTGSKGGTASSVASGYLRSADYLEELEYVKSQVLDALIWRCDSANEPRSFNRLRSVLVLGQQRREEVVPVLASIAMDPSREKWAQKDEKWKRITTFEYGSIRQAAGRSLRRLWVESEESGINFKKLIMETDRDLAGLLAIWADSGQHLPELEMTMKMSAQHCARRGIKKSLAQMAAFALGDIPGERSMDVLCRAFLDTDTEVETRWAISDALILREPGVVMHNVILPLINNGREGYNPAQTPYADLLPPPERAHEYHEQLLYLIGQLRQRHPDAIVFIESFLLNPKATYNKKARAMLALGYLDVREWKWDFARVAVGVFDRFDRMVFDSPPVDRENTYLRIKALQALSEIGDPATLRWMREERGRQRRLDHKPPPGWTSEVERAFFTTSEEINWREGMR
jgi:CHAT domain